MRYTETSQTNFETDSKLKGLEIRALGLKGHRLADRGFDS